MTRAALLVGGFGAALALRLLVGGEDVARSQRAGLVFAAALLALVAGARTRVPLSWRAVTIGLGGLVLVCLPVLLHTALTLKPLRGTEGFATWALAVTVVATAEELLLRGSLYDALSPRHGPVVAVAVGAVLFALLHVPLYGWHVVPLDLAVGVVLGGLRHEAGTPLAPAVAHVGADWVGWFVS